MRLTQTHVSFWQERKATPMWVRRMRADKRPHSSTVNVTSVHECVNAHAGLLLGRSKAYEAGNICATLKMVRNREGEQAMLQALWNYAHDPVSARRKAYARKWLRRLGRPVPHDIRASILRRLGITQ